MEEDLLQELAAQLRRPQGEKGIEVAHMMEHTNKNMTWSAIRNLKITAQDTLLEIGPGNAAHVTALLEQYQPQGYHAIEHSQLMVTEALRNNAADVAGGWAHFRVVEGDSIPYPAGYFSKIFTVNTLYFWPEPQAYLEQLYALLQNEGLLAITFAHASFMQELPFTRYHFRLYSLEEVAELVNASSFTLKDVVTEEEWVEAKHEDKKTLRTYSTVVLQKLS